MILTSDEASRRPLYFNMEFERDHGDIYFTMIIAATEDPESTVISLRGKMDHLTPPDVPVATILFQLGEINPAVAVSTESYSVLQKLISDHTLLGLFAGTFIEQCRMEIDHELAVNISTSESRSILTIHHNVMTTLGNPIPGTTTGDLDGDWFTPRTVFIAESVKRLHRDFEVTATRKISNTKRLLH